MASTMRAIVYRSYGSPDVLSLEEVDRPTPNDDEVLIRIHAVSINGSDRENLVGRPLYVRMAGLRRPRHPILGSDIAGRVEAVGDRHTEFSPGDELFGEIPGYHGGFAEYVCVSGRTMAPKPVGLSFEEAAAIPQAGVIALNGIRKGGKVQPGQSVLITGAGGSAGTFAVQLARLHGAEVTGVDHGRKLDFVRRLGADHVIDYTREDFTRGGARYDLILDLIAHRSVLAYRRALKPDGTYLYVGGSVATLLQTLLLAPLIRRVSGKHIRLLGVPQNRADLIAITELCVAGEIVPVIDRTYPLSETAQALRYVAEGRARGKVVISLDGAGTH